MFKLRYYCTGQGSGVIQRLLAELKEKHGIPYEALDLSTDGKHDEEKEKQVYEIDFKPRAKLLRKRTGDPISRLRSKRALHYFVSTPGTIAVITDEEIEWYTLEDIEIIEFLKTVLSEGSVSLKQCREET